MRLARLGGVLSIGRVLAGDERERYYLEQVGQGRDDYYAGEDDGAGEWIGTGASLLGATGALDEDGLTALLRGRDPVAGDQLRRVMREGGVSAFDLTFKPPKSVSLLWALSNEHVSAETRAAHDAAVRQALGYLESEACRGRRGKDGVRQVRAEGFVAAAFAHRTSRAGDPLLHTHVVIGNLALGEDGKWGALDSRLLFRHAKTAGFLYQAALRAELTERLGVEWGPVRQGCADLAGVRRDVVEHFSQRRAEVLEHMRERGARSARAAEVAVLETRRRKEPPVPVERLREQWRARAAEHGLDRHTVEALIDRSLEPRGEQHPAPDELTEQASTFTRRDVLQAVAAAQADGASVTRVEALADELLARPDVVELRRSEDAGPPERRFTTTAMLAIERGLIDGAERRRGEGAGVADREAVEQTLDERRDLSAEQAEAVRALTRSGDGVQVLRAAAGTGKTYALDAAKQAWERSDVHVLGCALSARAARELEDQAGVDATTIARLRIELERGRPLDDRTVLIVDEAGMVGSRALAELAEHAAEARAKLVLVGDDRQLPEIDAGGGFRGLADRLGAAELAEVRRQRHDWDRQALDALRHGDVQGWADAYRDHGRIVARPTADATRAQLVTDWWDAARQPGVDAVMIAHRRSDTADLNDRARALLRDCGALAGQELDVGGRSFAIGDRVVASRNDRALGVVNGDRGEVTGIDADRQTAQVRLARGATVDLDASYLEQGYLDYGYALTAHKAQGATVDRAYVLGSDDVYREWGYTALSRHREEARFYLVSPASIERNLPGLEPDEDPVVERLKEMLADSHAKTLALDELPDEPRLAEEALDHFRGLLADERHAANALQRAEEELDDTRTRLEQMQDEQAGLGRIFHRHERAALSIAIEGHERALAYWQEHVDAAEAELDAAVASREGWLTEHGQVTLALLNAESAARECSRDELRDELIARTRDAESIELGERDAWARTEIRAVEPVAELPPPAPDLDVGLDLGP
jgi:Ti-type conjugative transfer relaxase TraA